MKKYLATLHQRPTQHKQRFALLTSATVTLIIFVIWFSVNFGQGSTTTAENSTVKTVSPFAALGSGVAAAFQALKGDVVEVQKGLETVPTYGR